MTFKIFFEKIKKGIKKRRISRWFQICLKKMEKSEHEKSYQQKKYDKNE